MYARRKINNLIENEKSNVYLHIDLEKNKHSDIFQGETIKNEIVLRLSTDANTSLLARMSMLFETF